MPRSCGKRPDEGSGSILSLDTNAILNLRILILWESVLHFVRRVAEPLTSTHSMMPEQCLPL